ncbi:hypothetical protein Dfer_1281 [Dyadobacter fermentans DSM 18053]|uniref:Uncharacterized protein n=1 Tax=Dyadobacter fermentans (strain ATCC 700827 / DSM 18053 / CIP 107007 / KCTC 52180 / NS114) TaxID=471854 RepID=C6W649_DYAFD|nr:hypothetical protein Dfer_1281 [Dyadobacter fermentans DSM 18053]
MDEGFGAMGDKPAAIRPQGRPEVDRLAEYGRRLTKSATY